MKDLNGKNIIVTGASGGIGYSIIEKLDKVGANILASGTRIEKLNELKNKYVNIKTLRFDISQSNKIDEFIENATNELGGNLDCLINNASLFEKDDLENFNDKSFSKHLDINLKAPAFLIKDFKRYVRNKEANIINIIDQRVKKLTPFFFS